MSEHRSIELALLEGMDEHLLARLYQAGIRSRQDLAKAMETRRARAQLSADSGVSRERIEALHHLNFLLPEVRAGRFLALEEQVQNDGKSLRKLVTQSRNLTLALGILAASALVVALAALFSEPSSPPRLETEVNALRSQVNDMSRRVELLTPVARIQVESELASALKELGPAPGWYGPISWDEERQRSVSILGGSPEDQRLKAVGLALKKLKDAEASGSDAGAVDVGAARAALTASEFPGPEVVEDIWDMAAVLLKLRLNSRSLGKGASDEFNVAHLQLAPWSWTAPGFLQCEALVTRLESLPVQEDLFRLWNDTLGPLRQSANVARDKLGDRPEAWAREYWILRAELEMAVTAALLGRSTMRPYDGQSPRLFLQDRQRYLNRALGAAPASAKTPLAWLALEYTEAVMLESWVSQNPEVQSQVSGLNWVDALTVVEKQRSSGASTVQPVEDALLKSLAYSSLEPGSVPADERTRWEAGLRPLLMTTRDLKGMQPAAAPDS